MAETAPAPATQYEAKYTVTPDQTGNYFHKKTKRKATCSAVPGKCKRVSIPATGREDCAYKCINNTDEVRQALGGNRCMSFNFEDNSGFCEVLDRGYWSGQQHGWGKRWAVRKKDDNVNREAPAPTDPDACRVEVYEFADFNHWNATYYSTTDFRDIDKGRIGSVKVFNCAKNFKTAILWNDSQKDGIIVSDGEIKELDSYGATNQITNIEFRDVPYSDSNTHYIYRMNKLTGLDNRFGQGNADRLRESDRKSETILLNEDYKGDPCLGGKIYWDAKDRLSCEYPTDKEKLLPLLKQLDATIQDTKEPAASPRRGLYEELVGKHCADPENLLDVVGTDRKRCFDIGFTEENARQFCALRDNTFDFREEVCTSNNLGLDNYTALGINYCKKHPEENWCGCYNSMQQPNMCGSMTDDNNVNSNVAGCDIVYEQLSGMRGLVTPEAFRFYLNKKHCDFCATATGSDVFVPKNAMVGCPSTLQICSIQARYGQATDSDMENTCKQNASNPAPNTGTSATDVAPADAGDGTSGPAAAPVGTPAAAARRGTPSSSDTPASDKEDEDKDGDGTGLSTGAKAGIGIGVIAFMLLIIILVMSRRR